MVRIPQVEQPLRSFRLRIDSGQRRQTCRIGVLRYDLVTSPGTARIRPGYRTVRRSHRGDRISSVEVPGVVTPRHERRRSTDSTTSERAIVSIGGSVTIAPNRTMDIGLSSFGPIGSTQRTRLPSLSVTDTIAHARKRSIRYACRDRDRHSSVLPRTYKSYVAISNTGSVGANTAETVLETSVSSR